jgi:hypothetical protein
LASQARHELVAPKGIFALRFLVLDFTAPPLWLDLGSATADINGLMPFDDTNASNYPARFNFTSP